jgi:hypothetical protein
MNTETYERVAKNVGCTVQEMMHRHKAVMDAQAASLAASGVPESEMETKTLRMAAAEMRAERARLSRSGAKMLEGMFLTSPRYKDWGKVFYQKYANMLNPLSEEGRRNLVAQGLVGLYVHDDVDGGYTHIHNPSLLAKTAFAEGVAETNTQSLPKQATALDDGSFFVCIENKSSPTYPSGSQNYAYGKARATEDLERTCLFLGREQGTTSEPTLMQFTFRGDLAKDPVPTFMPGRIAASVSRNGDKAYAKNGVTVFNSDENVANIFPAPPLTSDGQGLIPTHLPLLDGLDSIHDYVGSLSDKEKWDAVVGVVLEVAHMDPRENGGYILTCADLDLTASTPPLDLYVGQHEESRVSFGVGSVIVAVGSPYIGREGDARLAINGWWAVEEMGSSLADEEVVAETTEEWE